MEDLEIDIRGDALECQIGNREADNGVLFFPGFAEDARSSKFQPLTEGVLDRDLAVLRANYRTTGMEQGEMTLWELSSDMRAAVRWMEERYEMGMVVKSMSAAIYLLSDADCPAVLWAPVNYPEDRGDVDADKRMEVKINELREREEKIYIRDNDLRRCRQSLLIIHGSEDEIAPLENAVWLSNVLPDADLEVLDGDDHHFNGKMDEAVDLTRRWLERKLNQ